MKVLPKPVNTECLAFVIKAKYKHPYILLAKGHLFKEDFLLAENRSRMKIMLIDHRKDLPVESIDIVL